MLQWDPPEFGRTPGGPASNVAVGHVRLSGRTAVLVKVGGDWYGDELVLKLNQERVQTRGIRFESKGDGEASRRTGCSHMRVKEMGDGRVGMEVVKNSPGDLLRDSELNLEVLKAEHAELLPLHREEISPLWHDKLKFLFVTDGTLQIHYYGPGFDRVVVGTEDVLITPFTCDRTGSGDAVVAALLRKLTTHPEMYSNKDYLERRLRFAIAAGIIAQWTIGAVRGFPTESATQNLKEQVYVPSMW